MQQQNHSERAWPELAAYILPPLVIAFYLAAPYFSMETSSSVIMVLLFSAGGIITLVRYRQFLLLLLCTLVPLSVQYEFAGSSKISFPAELIAAAFSVLLLVKLARGYKITAAFLRHPLTMLAAADIAWLLLTSCTSEMPAVSFKRAAVRTVFYIAFYYFFFELYRTDDKNLRRVPWLYLAALVIPATYTLWQHAGIRFTMIGSEKICAPFYFDHTIYGASLAVFIPYLVFETLDKRSRTWYKILLLIFLAAALILSYSRAAWLSLIIASAVQAIFYFRIRTRTLLFAAAASLALAFANTQKITSIFTQNKQESHTNNLGNHVKSVSNINTDVSNRERINRWKCALRMFADKPVFGFGPGTYQFFYGPYQLRTELTRISTFNGNKGHAHSEYLNYLSETGLPGLLIFGTLFIVAIVKGLRLARQGPYQKMALAFTCAIITFVVHGFFNGFLEFDKIALPVFASMAAITYMDLRSKMAC